MRSTRPTAGGDDLSVRLTTRRLDPASALRELGRAGPSGGLALFLGAVRPDRTSEGTVEALWYEADERMGRTLLDRISVEAARRPGVRAVVLWHRVGRLRVGEIAVVVGAAADHRAQAFDAARELIERVKHEVPIWKTDRVRSPGSRRGRSSRGAPGTRSAARRAARPSPPR